MSEEDQWGLRCPKCKATSEDIVIQVKVWVRLYDNGSEVQDGDHEWNDASRAVCDACDFEGLVANFRPHVHRDQIGNDTDYDESVLSKLNKRLADGI